MAEAERQLISGHTGFHDSPIFRYKEDYSQYVARGHYTRSEALQQYFKTMMWYGRLAFLLKGSPNYGPSGEALVSPQDARIQTLQAVLLALALDRLGEDYRIKTSLYSTAKPKRNGTLKGDLIVFGRGDPTLNQRETLLARIARALPVISSCVSPFMRSAIR